MEYSIADFVDGILRNSWLKAVPIVSADIEALVSQKPIEVVGTSGRVWENTIFAPCPTVDDANPALPNIRTIP